jgi:hypothetical protein
MTGGAPPQRASSTGATRPDRSVPCATETGSTCASRGTNSCST